MIEGDICMNRMISLMLSVTLIIALAACSPVKDNLNGGTIQSETANPSTVITAKATPPSQTVEPKTQNSTSTPEASPKTETTSIPNVGVKADNFYIEEIVSSYERLLVHAINDNDFSLIKNLLMPESNIYKSQEQFVSEQFNKGIKYKFIDIYPEEIKQGSKKNEYKAYVISNIEISEPNKGKETKEFKRIYTVLDDGKIRKITDIQEWKK